MFEYIFIGRLNKVSGMQAAWVILLFSAATTFALPLEQALRDGVLTGKTPRNNALEQQFLNLLETLRETIKYGYDPLEVASISLDDSVIPLPGTNVDMKGVTVSNLGTFVVDELSINRASLLPLRYRAILTLRIPELEFDSEYYNLFLSALGYNIYGSGDAKIKITNLRISLNLLLRVRVLTGTNLSLDSTNVVVKLDEFKPQINGIFDHQGASDFINLFLEDFVPSVVEAYEAEITEFLSETVHDILNEILEDLDLGSIISPSLFEF